jgi:hypothetical protein
MNDLTYLKDGHEVKTSRFLRNRGTCCKTSCLHCPYGFTIKTEGLQFETITEDNFVEASSMCKKESSKENSVASNLLAGAFGRPKSVEGLTNKNKGQYLLVKLKGESCALIKKKNLQATDIFLNNHFDDQDITLEMVNSYL